MAVISVASLKTYFQTGDFPTESNFVDLIDTLAALPVAVAATTMPITNDVTTNATMYPVWVTANSGSLPLKVSSTGMAFNPSNNRFLLGNKGVTPRWPFEIFANVDEPVNSFITNTSTGTSATARMIFSNFTSVEFDEFDAHYGQIGYLGRNHSATYWQDSLLIGAGGQSKGIRMFSDGESAYFQLSMRRNNGNLSADFDTPSIYVKGGSAAEQLVVGNASVVGNVGIRTATPTAKLHLGVGTATANTSPLKFTTQGTAFLTVAEAGAIEYGTIGFVIQNDALTLGGTALISQEKLSIQSTANASLFTNLRTTSNGTAAFGFHRVTNDAGKVMDFGVPGSGYTTSGGLIGSYGTMYSNGTGINIISDAASSTINFYTGGFAAGNKFITINGTGQLSGTALHNNAGAVTGTTNQFIASGTYTPTITADANLSATTAYVCQWIRVGNVVTVSGQFDLDPITTATLTYLHFTLPIASALATNTQLSGASTNAFNEAARITADTADDQAYFTYTPISVANNLWSFTFTYLVL